MEKDLTESTDASEDESVDLATITIDDEVLKSFRRLDQFLSEQLSLSRTYIKKIFEQGLITSPRTKLSLSKLPPIATKIFIQIPPPIDDKALPENIPLTILYEDDDLIMINKPAGMVVHPAPGHSGGTLVNALLYHCPNLQGIGGVKRPGIVHRLDIGTTGVMVAAKNSKAHEEMVLLFSGHQVQKTYQAIVVVNDLKKQRFEPTGTFQSIIGRHASNRLKMAVLPSNSDRGKMAITHYQLLSELAPGIFHLQVKIETGRTHQIRVHLATHLYAPIMMDPLYGNPKDHLTKMPDRLRALLQTYQYPLLHSRTLSFIHPITKRPLNIEAPYSEAFERILQHA